MGNHRFISGLDGLRALAVIAVIAYHLFPSAVPGGYIGVDLFFVISGFLITTLLIAEHARSGKVRLGQFWLRRARRLLPALFTTILVVGSIMFFVRGDISVGIGRQILGAATFSSNWMEIAAGTDYFNSTVPHLFLNFWSLGVEEQFYLLWPFIALLIIAGIKRPRIGMALTVLLALGSAGWMAYAYANGASATRVYYGTDTHLFGLMIGAALAFWARAHAPGQALRRLFTPFSRLVRLPVLSFLFGFGALGGWLYLAFTMSDQTSFAYFGGMALASVLSALIIVVAASGKGAFTRLFSLRPLVWAGKRSYGIYLWHWPLLVLLRLFLPSSTAVWIYPAVLVPLTFAIAALSYRFIEQPVRRRGFKATFAKAFRHKSVAVDAVTTRVHHRPHLALAPITAAIILTVSMVVTAPTKTSAQLRIEEGQKAIQHQLAAQAQVKLKPAASTKSHVATNTHSHAPISGKKITAIGDSVMLGSAPHLQVAFPGIVIDAKISRSMRNGGLETVEKMKSAGTLRPVVIVALGTNGYYGTGLLDQMIRELKGYDIVLVTAHADRLWTQSNNDNVHAAAKKYDNVAVAEWDRAISPHPGDLADDGIHPINASGDEIYASCIKKALLKFEQ